MADAELDREAALQMQPLSWGSCFGWIHYSPACAASDVVAIICSGVGRDSSTGYRPTRYLADQLALAGHVTIRFSYPGTGDSLEPARGNPWAAWIESIHGAIDSALVLAGARRVILVGVRLGATLAALIADEREEVVGLVLLEPVVRGSSFATQLRIEERVSTGGAALAHDGIRIHGLQLTEQALSDMAAVDLCSLALGPSRGVLVLSSSKSAILRGCEDAWRLQGADVVHGDADGMSAFFRPTHLADEPFPDVKDVLGWLQARFPMTVPSASVVRRPGRCVLSGSGWRETPHFLGADEHLFGILCEPEPPNLSDTVVIIGNGGGDPHDGFARFAVDFARRLARSGVASFRMDFAGLGDSVNAADDRDGVTHTFAVDRRPDFAAAVDFASSRGFRTIALHGLCSGAYHALQAAVADPRVGLLLCVNLPWFSLRYERAGPGSFAQFAYTTLAARGLRCLLLFAEGDAGLKPLEQHFGARGDDFAAHPGFHVVIRSGLDHDLTRPEMQRIAADEMMALLHQCTPDVSRRLLPIRDLITEGVA